MLSLNPKRGSVRNESDATGPDTVPFNIRILTRRPVRQVLTWLLALVLPLQGMAVGVLTVMGPAHMHKQADVPMVLTDFRRWKPAPVRETGVFALLGHSHGSASPQRHYHPFEDASVVRADGDGLVVGSDVDEGLGASASVASVLALIRVIVAWGPSQGSSAPASRPFWTSVTGFTEPLDRPPKLG